jgi:hypothetical protein
VDFLEKELRVQGENVRKVLADDPLSDFMLIFENI